MTEELSLRESENEVSFGDLLNTIQENLRLLAFGPIAVGLIALAVSFFIPPTYTARTQFLPPQQQQSSVASMFASIGGLGGIGGIASAAAGLKNPADQFIAYLKSHSVQNALIERYDLNKRYNQKYKIDSRKVLQNKTRINSGKEGLIILEVDDEDPQFAADLANAHIEELSNLLGRLAVTEAQKRRVFFESQLNLTKNKLIEADHALKISGVSENILKSNPINAVSILVSLKAQITVQEIKIGTMRGYLAETSQELKQALMELENLKAQLVKQDTNSLLIKNEKSDYISKYREYKYQENLLELFSKQLELARIDEAREGSVIQVVDIAEKPERKEKPNKAYITIISSIVAFIVTIIFIISRKLIKNVSKENKKSLG